MDTNGNPDVDTFTPAFGGPIASSTIDVGAADTGFASALAAASPYGDGYTPVTTTSP
jgi:hypothetical protein